MTLEQLGQSRVGPGYLLLEMLSIDGWLINITASDQIRGGIVVRATKFAHVPIEMHGSSVAEIAPDVVRAARGLPLPVEDVPGVAIDASHVGVARLSDRIHRERDATWPREPSEDLGRDDPPGIVGGPVEEMDVGGQDGATAGGNPTPEKTAAA